MTCIVGVVDNGHVYIGGDSAGVGGDFSLQVRADKKVFVKGPFLFGFTTSFRMGQLLRFGLHISREPLDSEDVFQYMCTDFITDVRDVLKKGGWATKKDEVEQGGTFLVGVRGRLFKIDSDYQVGESADPFDAVGIGAQIALGSMYSTADWTGKPHDRIHMALRAAERYSAGVRSPFVSHGTDGSISF